MVVRDEFDAALLKRAEENGARLRQRAQVRAIDQADGHATARLADGTEVTAKVIIGADGSSGVTARHVGAEFDQVDLGLELEIAVPDKVARQWAGRVLLDWGKIPASYGWVFPKGDRLTVGVIAARGQGEATKAYLREFVGRLGLAGYEAVQDSGHLTRCRSDGSPLRKGRVIVAGDAAACSTRGPARASASPSAPVPWPASTPPRATSTATSRRSTPGWSPTCARAGPC